MTGCGGAGFEPARAPVAPSKQGDKEAAAAAISALVKGSFAEAEKLATAGIAQDGENPYPRLVRAIATHKRTIEQLNLDGRTLVINGMEGGNVNEKYFHATFGDAERDLSLVEEDLAVAAKRSGLSLDLCLACWSVDWNGDGRINHRDERLLEIERDATGNELPEGDPRRRPTFRFDDGDVPWARAFVNFERAALDVLLAYDWTEVARIVRARRDRPSNVVIHLIAPERMAAAKRRLLEGLSQSDAARIAYLAETDDEREWVPNPNQRNHPLPLPVDAALYSTWEGVVSDVRKIVQGQEGLYVADMALLAGEHLPNAPRGALNFGEMLSHPKDIVLDLEDIERLDRARDAEGAMVSLFGDYYVRDMKPSPLLRRLLSMKAEMDEGGDELGRKLRYLLWLN
jgi:hypothetical protein